MSVIVVVRKGGTAVIGADTAECASGMLVRADYVVNHSKLLRAGDSWLGLAGWSAAQSIMESALKREDLGLAFTDRHSIFESARKLHEKLKSDYFIDTQEDKEQPVESSQVSGVIASQHGIFELESYRSVVEYARFWAIGSGDKLAIGAMHAVYDGCDDPVVIAETGLRAACAFDEGCALPFETRVVELAAD